MFTIARLLLAILLAGITGGQAIAQTEKYIQTLSGVIKKGDSCIVTDDKFGDPEKWAGIEKHLSVDNLITFELRYDTTARLLDRNFSCRLQLDIVYQKADRTSEELKNIQLDINYDTTPGIPHRGIAYYKFKGGHIAKLTVNKISSAQWKDKLPPIFRIRNEIFIERHYTLDTKTPVNTVESYAAGSASLHQTINKKILPGGNISQPEIKGSQQIIHWDGSSPAFPQYDLEWTFYDDNSLIGAAINQHQFGFSANELNNLFKNNCSRVTVSLPFYQLNLVYNRGWIFNRVRGVRYDALTGERTEGAWSYAGDYPYNGNFYGLIRSDGHEEFLNWQYNSAFAEEGKRTEIVHYFDGSLRARQTVTLNNDDATTSAVVQEDIPDGLGRFALTVLPAPTEESSLHYFPSFNKSAVSGKPYRYTDFETGSGCAAMPAAMSPLSGAAQYYSALNPRKDDNSPSFYFTKYIPDAEGFPFSVTHFTADNTGRINTRGGFGKVFQPGNPAPANDHSTRYFYGKPRQEELDRLFGNEAGNASHYLKNMTIDANGQASVSYTDAAGNTVATALAGKSPDNLQQIPSYKFEKNAFVTSLADPDNIERDAANLSLTCNSSFMAVAPGSFTLRYAFTPLSLQVLYGVENEKICADCYYDLHVRITDGCGNLVQSANSDAVFTEKTSCLPAPAEQQGQIPVTIAQPGEYHISWQLLLSRKAIDYYTDQYLIQDLSIKKDEDFMHDYLHKMDMQPCFNDCTTCLTALGSEQDFIARMTRILKNDNNLQVNKEDTAWMETQYTALFAECNFLQEGCGQANSPCEEQTQQLKEDVSPGGQYMLYDHLTYKFKERDLNVFLTHASALTADVTVDGVTKHFNQFSEEQIISNWQGDWANLLLPFHPENRNNCLIASCARNAASEQYDNDFLNTADAGDATRKGFWLGDDYLFVVNKDPYFKTPDGAAKKTGFVRDLNQYQQTGVDIMSFVRWSVYCQNKSANGSPPLKITACPRSTACDQANDEWNLFKILYYNAKHETENRISGCNSNDLFSAAVEILKPASDASVPVALPCASADLFDVSNDNGLISVRYNGAQPTVQNIDLQYFAVDNNGLINSGAGGMVRFPAGTVGGFVKTITGIKDLAYVIDFARCDLAHPYYTKTRRNYDGIDLQAAADNLQTKSADQLNAAATSNVINECNGSCELNADGWMQKLDGCGLNIGATEYSDLRSGLLAVCKNSCQTNVANHPFGASSTDMVTVYGDKSFKDVLVRVLGKQRFSSVCNDLLLDYPTPADMQPLYTNEIIRTLQPCAYKKLVSWKADYSLTNGYAGLAEYIKKEIDPAFTLTDADISNLLKTYEDNCLLPHPILLPASLSCAALQPVTCLSCVAFRDEEFSFLTEHDYVKPDSDGYYSLLAKYINQKYTFNLSSVDIYHALQQCAADTVPPADSINCATLDLAWQHFNALRPTYFIFPGQRSNADSLYQNHLTLWLNTELHRQLSFGYYSKAAARCGLAIDAPPKGELIVCDTIAFGTSWAPRFITCCEPFAELERFTSVLPGAADARLLALYFSLQHTRWDRPVNLPAIDYTLPYDSIVHYFAGYRPAASYTVTVRPDSLLSYTAGSSGFCTPAALAFSPAPPPTDLDRFALCNKPVQPLLPEDDNSCLNQQINIALGNAHSDYLEYLEKIKRDYRQAYYSKCLSIQPRLLLEAEYDEPMEYHYTLYYYDRAGNLVKTIPPAGIQPVNEEPDGAGKMQRIKNFRLADKDYCYEYGDAASMNGTSQISIADNSLIQQNSMPFTIEAFVNFSNTGASQVIISKQSVNPSDSKTDGYRVYLSNGRLMVDLAAHGKELWVQTLSTLVQYMRPPPYNLLPPVSIRSKKEVPVFRNLYRTVTAQITSDINGLLTAGQWTHVAVVRTDDWNNPIKIYINGNPVSSSLLSNNYDYVPAAAPALTAADIAAGTIAYSFTYSSTVVPLNVSNTNSANLVIGAAAGGFTGSIKQFRLYNRALSNTEIRNNAFNTCLVPSNKSRLALWLPLNKEEAAGTTLDRINGLTAINQGAVFSSNYQPLYPQHKLPTCYYYNSLDAIVRQISPDGGEINFFYDITGRLTASQNAEQKRSDRKEPDNRYSYTRYDALGRPVETGEKSGAPVLTSTVAKTDPTTSGSAINLWLNSGTNTQIIETIYDLPNTAVVTNTSITTRQNLYNTSRKRILATIYRDHASAPADYNYATHYQYDINGNIKQLWQEQKKSVSGLSLNLLKNFQYDYDLLSGKVNQLIYQKDKGDQFVYQYEYDPANRLVRAFSGREPHTLQQDAGYRYYLHGPLARIELGDAFTSRIVQGSDYVYTLQGWLKGVNGVQLNSASTNAGAADAGGDGSTITSGGIHNQVGADAVAYSLGYYKDDYLPIGGAISTAFNFQYNPPLPGARDGSGKMLFDGNISNSLYRVTGIDNDVQGYTYGYDQLSRLREMHAHRPGSLLAAGHWDNQSILPDYQETFTYDGNGNISSLFRNGTVTGARNLDMDDQSYAYYYYTAEGLRRTYLPSAGFPSDAWRLTNQLAHIKDRVTADKYPSPAYPEEKDIDDQSDQNYGYDGIGNLVQDVSEGIDRIAWTAYGKIRSISKTDGTTIAYDYDAAGNRVQKLVIAGTDKTITSYVRDAQGSSTAVYSWKGGADKTPAIADPGNGLAGQIWEEQYLYGNRRLGMWQPGITVPATLNIVTDAVLPGSKFFELTNHTGNVMAVISDKKIAVPSGNNPSVTDHYAAEVVSATNYTPFGMQMPGRSYLSARSTYRYGFNGKENDNEVKGTAAQQDYGMRVYDGRVGRFLSLDPIMRDYPMLTPYQFAANNPVSGVDQDGLEYSPAGKLGPFTIDQTAVQLYPDNPNVMIRQRANVPWVHLNFEIARIHSQPSYLEKQWQPANDFERQRHEVMKAQWYDQAGYNADGTPKALTTLAQNKTWNAFATNLALPFLDLASYADGEGEFLKLLEAASKNTSRQTVTALVDHLLSSTSAVKELDSKAIVGYRGSLATGIKYKTGLPFNPQDFDVDAFIVSDKLSKQFSQSDFFRSGNKIKELESISGRLEDVFKQIPGYRSTARKPLTFRIYTNEEFKSKIQPNGYKAFK